MTSSAEKNERILRNLKDARLRCSDRNIAKEPFFQSLLMTNQVDDVMSTMDGASVKVYTEEGG